MRGWGRSSRACLTSFGEDRGLWNFNLGLFEVEHTRGRAVALVVNLAHVVHGEGLLGMTEVGAARRKGERWCLKMYRSSGVILTHSQLAPWGIPCERICREEEA